MSHILPQTFPSAYLGEKISHLSFSQSSIKPIQAQTAEPMTGWKMATKVSYPSPQPKSAGCLFPESSCGNPSPSFCLGLCLGLWFAYTEEFQLGFQGKPDSHSPIGPSRLVLQKDILIFSTRTALLYKDLLIIVKV